MTVMPAAFFGHGNPMNALEKNRYTEAWRAFGQAVPRPRAILVVSAHWYVQATAVTAMPRPRTIHDFYGFPPELFAGRLPAAGAARPLRRGRRHRAPDVGGRRPGQLGDRPRCLVGADARVPGRPTSPSSSCRSTRSSPFDYHLQLGAALAPLREDGVLVIGSGNVVHNLGGVSRALPDAGFDWAQRFDEQAKEMMLTDPTEVGRLDGHRDFDLAVPTPDHFLPLLYVAGVAGATSTPAEVLVDGYAYGSLSMTAYTVGHDPAPASGDAGRRRGCAAGGTSHGRRQHLIRRNSPRSRGNASGLRREAPDQVAVAHGAARPRSGRPSPHRRPGITWGNAGSPRGNSVAPIAVDPDVRPLARPRERWGRVIRSARPAGAPAGPHRRTGRRPDVVSMGCTPTNGSSSAVPARLGGRDRPLEGGVRGAPDASTVGCDHDENAVAPGQAPGRGRARARGRCRTAGRDWSGRCGPPNSQCLM